MSSEVRVSRTTKVRVPNPARPVKGRLDAKPARVHAPKKRYRRRPKHMRPVGEE